VAHCRRSAGAAVLVPGGIGHATRRSPASPNASVARADDPGPIRDPHLELLLFDLERAVPAGFRVAAVLPHVSVRRRGDCPRLEGRGIPAREGVSAWTVSLGLS